MPFLTRGKARARLNRPKMSNISCPPVSIEKKEEQPSPASIEETSVPENLKEEQKISYQEVTYRVPKEERLLDLPLEEEIPEEELNVPDETGSASNEENVAIGVVLKKKKKK